MSNNLILTSAFNRVAKELQEKGYLPQKSCRVAFIPTAADFYESKPWMEADREALIESGYSLFNVELKGRSPDQLKKALLPSEIIFVAGGNTTYLVDRARASGFYQIIRDLLKDRIYVGSSAGSILAGPTVEPFLEDELPDLPKGFVLQDTVCLGLVDYVVLPHYPRYAESNDKAFQKYKDRFKFVKMTDEEYRIETL